jgi:hypothetical protein
MADVADKIANRLIEQTRKARANAISVSDTAKHSGTN